MGFLRHCSCPACDSSDAGAEYDNGTAYCHKCGAYWKIEGEGTVATKSKKREELPGVDFEGIRARKLLEDSCRRFKYGKVHYKGARVQAAVYCHPVTGNPVAVKLRLPDKDFLVQGSMKEAGLYGQQIWRKAGKMLVVTEGEIDAISVSQVLGHRWPVVSVPNGAQGALKAIKAQIEWVEKFDRVVFAFDMDKPGRQAAVECAEALTPGKGHIAVFPRKDANEHLQHNEGEVIVDAVWSAKPHRPDGIVSGDAVLTAMMTSPPPAVAYPWQGLTDITKGGMRAGELVVWTAGTGVGKSTVVREVAWSLVERGEKVGYIGLEESVRTSALAILSVPLERRLLLSYNSGVELDDDVTTLWQSVSDRLYFYDHFGSLDLDNMLSKIRYLVKATGCSWIFLDHLSILMSGLEIDNERRALDVAMTRLRSFVEETQCGMHVVSHLSRTGDGSSHEEGARVQLRNLRGSQSIPQLADYVIALERDQQAVEGERNRATLRVLKGGRIVGETGVACELVYNTDTGRLQQAEALEFE